MFVRLLLDMGFGSGPMGPKMSHQHLFLVYLLY